MNTSLLSCQNDFEKTSSIFSACASAHKLINEGKEKEAKELYPLEFYLVKKYLLLNLDDFRIQLRTRLELS